MAEQNEVMDVHIPEPSNPQGKKRTQTEPGDEEEDPSPPKVARYESPSAEAKELEPTPGPSSSKQENPSGDGNNEGALIVSVETQGIDNQSPSSKDAGYPITRRPNPNCEHDLDSEEEREDEEEEEDEEDEEEEEEDGAERSVEKESGDGQGSVSGQNGGQPASGKSVAASEGNSGSGFHSVLLCRSAMMFADKDKSRRRRLSDSYRPDMALPPVFFPTVTNKCRFTRRTSYSLDDLREIFPSAKLEYFRLPKAFPRKTVKMESSDTTAATNVTMKVRKKQSPTSETPCSNRRSSPPRRCRFPNCDHTSNQSPLILYPTDQKGQADLSAVHKYSFAARLVKPHPHSYRTARGGHMQWCRYEDDLMKLPLCLQFEVAFAAPDRHRIKLDIPRTTENSPTDIAELGFYFDAKDGILKEQDTKTSGFYYVKERLDKDKRRSRYILAVLGSYNYVMDLMIKENMQVVRKQILKLNGLYDVYSPLIYLSNETGKRDKLIVLVASKRVARPGVWSVRTLLHREGGINIGSMLPYIRQAHREGYSVLVANPNENHFVHPNLVDISHIPRHASPAEHMASLWTEEIYPASYARHVYLVLHETAYQAFFLPLIRERLRKRESSLEMETARQTFFQQLRERVRGVATIGAVPQLGMNLALRPEMVQWLQQHTINFVPSTEPAETFLKRHTYGQIQDIRQISAGTKDHDRIPETIRPVVFRFFASQHRRWVRQSEGTPAPAPAPTACSSGATESPAVTPCAGEALSTAKPDASCSNA